MRRRIIVLLALGMLSAFAIAGCQPQSVSVQKNTTVQDEPMFTDSFEWSPDSKCEICHSVEAGSHEGSAYPSDMAADLACSTCHDNRAGLESAHAGVTLADSSGADRLRVTGVNTNACVGCHGGFADLALKTQDSTVLTDVQKRVVNPHDFPKSDSHATLTCASCHKVHSEKSIAETAQGACTSCHHTGAYECNTCHAAEG